MTRFFVNDTEDLADEDFADEPVLEKNWRWVAAVAGVVLVGAVAGTAMILGGGDSGSTAGKVTPPTSLPAAAPPAPATSIAPLPSVVSSGPPETMTRVTPSTSPSVVSSGPPETMTRVTPSTSPSGQAPTAPAAPGGQAPTAPAAPGVDPSTVTYTVSGNHLPGDLVTIIYSDEQGAFHTDLNVSLPWTKTVVPNPGVTVNSVTATSFASQLNCTITDAQGATIASLSLNTIAATCNR